MSRYRLSQEAQTDLRDIQAYLVQQGGTRLARFVTGHILQGMRRIADTPGAGHARQDLTDEPVKFWPIFSYLIVYDPAMQPVGTSRVLHTAQDLETLFKVRPPRL